MCSWNKYSARLTSSITAGGAGSCQTKEAWLAIESLNAAPFPPQSHGIYINLQLFLAGGNFFFPSVHEEELRFVATLCQRSGGDSSAPRVVFLLANRHRC